MKLQFSKLILLVLLLFNLCGNIKANSKIDGLLDEKTTVESLQQMVDWTNPAQQINDWHSLMPKQPDSASREKILNELPPSWKNKQIKDERILTEFGQRIAPALRIFNKSYEIILIDYSKPVLMVDSDAVLIVTTELLKIIKTGDELSGLILHEEAHSIFREKSLLIKADLKTAQRENAIKNLALIELMCDTIAAFTLKQMGRDPVAFLNLIVHSEASYEADKVHDNYHPSGKTRLYIISALLAKYKK